MIQTINKANNSNQKVYYSLLIIIIFGSYIPLGILSFSTLVSPLDIIYIISMIFLVIFSKGIYLFRIKYIKTIIFSYGLYIFLRFILQNYIKNQPEIFPVFTYINPIILIYLFAQINEFKYVMKLFNFLLLVISISMIIGLLSTFIGEPFASIRIFLSNNENLAYLGKNDRVVGLDETIFGFGYTISFLPLLLLIKYHFSKNPIYISLILLSILTILLNGERSTLIFSSIFFNIYLSYLVKRKRVYILLAGVLMVILLLFINISSNKNINITSYARLQNTTWLEDDWRIVKQYIGLNVIMDTPFTGGNINNYEMIYYQKYGLYPTSIHNSYINVGMYTGVLGWLFLILALFSIYKILLIVFKSYDNNKIKLFYWGLILSFLIPMCNALLHNAGIFTSEKNIWILLGFLISRYVKVSCVQKF